MVHQQVIGELKECQGLLYEERRSGVEKLGVIQMLRNDIVEKDKLLHRMEHLLMETKRHGG